MTVTGLISLYSGGALATLGILTHERRHRQWRSHLLMFCLTAALAWPSYWLTAALDAIFEEE